MHFSKLAITAAGLALFNVARADDLDLDDDDIPSQCRSLCEPVKRLTDICEVDDDDRLTDREEDLLQAQCFCTNSSFDVAGRTAQCAACMHENNRDRDDNEDIDDIMWTCGFASATYDSSAQTTAVNVDATRPVSAAEITTTIEGGARQSGNPSATTTGTNSQNTGDNSGNSNSNDNQNTDSAASSTPSDDDSAAAGVVPMGSLGGFVGFGVYIAAAAVAGGMLFH